MMILVWDTMTHSMNTCWRCRPEVIDNFKGSTSIESEAEKIVQLQKRYSKKAFPVNKDEANDLAPANEELNGILNPAADNERR